MTQPFIVKDGNGASQTFGVSFTSDGKQISIVDHEGQSATYSAGVNGLVTVSGATDVITLSGSATKTIRITRFQVGGTLATAAFVNVSLVKRTTANTGGTSTTQAGVQYDSTDPAPTAVLTAYTANPTALGTSANAVAVARLYFAATGTPGPVDRAVIDFGTRNTRSLVLRGTSEFFCVNLNTTGSAGNLSCSIEWTEE